MSSLKHALVRLVPTPVRRGIVRLGNYYASQMPATQPGFPSQEASLRTLETLGWSPRACIDVGAYHGEWAGMFRSFFPNCSMLMIEAQQGKQRQLDEAATRLGPGVAAEIALLGSQDDVEVDFAEMETGSSVFQESSFVDRQVVRKRLVTLDSLLERHQEFRDSQFLKIDTQGYELEVLKGAEKLVRRLDAILMEVSLVPTNQGCPLLDEVVQYMKDRDFIVFDFCSQIRRRDGVLWQTDLLFIRRGGGIRVDATLTTQNWHVPARMLEQT